MRFARTYLKVVADLLNEMSAAQIEAATDILYDAYSRGASVFLAGNGGSAAIATHLACDLEKTVAGPRGPQAPRRLRAVSLNDNVSALTAWANDEGYEHVFSERLRGYANQGDVLIVISSSGNSPNIIEALKAADELGLRSIAWLGFDGGRAFSMATCSIHVPVKDYGMVEGIHGVVAHLVTDILAQAIRGKRSSYRPSTPVVAGLGAK
jgi:D-sedoheptulose 7-phosphate isomerase